MGPKSTYFSEEENDCDYQHRIWGYIAMMVGENEQFYGNMPDAPIRSGAFLEVRSKIGRYSRIPDCLTRVRWVGETKMPSATLREIRKINQQKIHRANFRKNRMVNKM